MTVRITGNTVIKSQTLVNFPPAPALNLDFTTGVLPAPVTFTRATIGTYYNSAGLLTTALSGVPRFDYDPVTTEPKGLLIEEQRTNISLHSNNFSNAVWNASAVTSLTPNSGISPDGQNNAWAVAFSASTSSEIWQQYSPASNTYTMSVWARVASGTGKFRFKVWTGSVIVNSSDFTVTTVWQRFTFTTTNTLNNNSIENASDGVARTVLFYGFQTEVGPFATSYIPTTSASVTRNADVATVSGGNFSSWWNTSVGTVRCVSDTEYAVANASSSAPRVWQIDDGSENNLFTVFYFQSTGIVGPAVYASAVGQNIPSAPLAPAANVFSSTATGWQTNYLGFSLNGGSSTPNTTLTVPTGMTTLRLGNRFTGDRNLNGHIKSFQYWPVRFTDAQLQLITK